MPEQKKTPAELFAERAAAMTEEDKLAAKEMFLTRQKESLLKRKKKLQDTPQVFIQEETSKLDLALSRLSADIADTASRRKSVKNKPK